LMCLLRSVDLFPHFFANQSVRTNECELNGCMVRSPEIRGCNYAIIVIAAGIDTSSARLTVVRSLLFSPTIVSNRPQRGNRRIHVGVARNGFTS
jgi:hypothetical protein